jgi:hypothetical protein
VCVVPSRSICWGVGFVAGNLIPVLIDEPTLPKLESISQPDFLHGAFWVKFSVTRYQTKVLPISLPIDPFFMRMPPQSSITLVPIAIKIKMTKVLS